MPPLSPVEDGKGPETLPELEELIAWRRLQLQALHRLRLGLAAALDGSAGEAGMLPHAGQRCDNGDAVIRVAGDVEVRLDTCFLEQGEREALGRVLRVPDRIAAADAALLRQRLAARIDELNQLNRCGFELLRVLASCRREPAPLLDGHGLPGVQGFLAPLGLVIGTTSQP